MERIRKNFLRFPSNTEKLGARFKIANFEKGGKEKKKIGYLIHKRPLTVRYQREIRTMPAIDFFSTLFS